MTWLELSVSADGEATEAVSEIFNRYADEQTGTSGAVVEVNGFDSRGELTQPELTVRTYIRQGAHATDLIQQLEESLWHLRMLHAFGELQVRELLENDWANAWKAHYQPIRLGERLFVVPSWLDAPTQPNDIVIRLDPGMAFGTGTHPSTRLCLLNLERHLRVGDRVLDVGTGSGILAIAAAKLGAPEIIATDIDPLAVRIAAENAFLNDVSAQITFVETPLPETDTRFDVIVVNILADVIINLLDGDLLKFLAPKGRLILAGIIDTWADGVLAALERNQLRLVERRDDGDWVSLVAEN